MVMISARFPRPPAIIEEALAAHAVVRSGDREAIAELGDSTHLDPPWNPAACGDEVRHALWTWLEDVAAWVNHEFGWRTDKFIPACWPHHPHIVAELPVLACLRWNAEQSNGPDLLEDWHRYALPMFADRMVARLGESSCRTGRHVDWPAAGRHQAFLDSAAGRAELFHADTHPPIPLRRVNA